MQRILCLGAGAVGGYYCARLIEAGADVTFLVRAQRRNRLAEHGLRLESTYGNFASPVKAIVKSELSGPFDIILLTCKAYDLTEAIEAIAPAVGRGTAILPLLNGVAHIDLLNTAYGRDSGSWRRRQDCRHLAAGRHHQTSQRLELHHLRRARRRNERTRPLAQGRV